jgi:hypothetical protein
MKQKVRLTETDVMSAHVFYVSCRLSMFVHLVQQWRECNLRAETE